MVRGRIAAFKTINRGSFHYYDAGVDFKMLVELENKSTVWGSQISSLIDVDADIGDLIEFTATFTQAENDDTHSFYKRPSKAKIISKKEGESIEAEI